MLKKRNNYSAQEKVAILKRHLLEKVPVSDLCDENSVRRGARNVRPVRMRSGCARRRPADEPHCHSDAPRMRPACPFSYS